MFQAAHSGGLFSFDFSNSRGISAIPQHIGSVDRYRECPLHNLPLKYFCCDCITPICSDCGVIDRQVNLPHAAPGTRNQGQGDASHARGAAERNSGGAVRKDYGSSCETAAITAIEGDNGE